MPSHSCYYQTCSADETFLKISNGVSPKTHFQDKGKPSHEVWLLQAITHGLPALCTPYVPPDTILDKPTLISSR